MKTVKRSEIRETIRHTVICPECNHRTRIYDSELLTRTIACGICNKYFTIED